MRGPGVPGALARDQTGQDADGAEVRRGPAPDGAAEEDRAVAVALLLVEQAEPGEGEELVDRHVGLGVVRRPRQHRRRDELRVAGREGRVVEAELAGAGGP